MSEEDRALCEYAAKMTHHQHEMGQEDVDRLRGLGFSDEAIHDAAQVIAYFNYITRIADALGVENEDFVRAWEETAEPLEKGSPGD